MKLLTNLLFEPKGRHDSSLAYSIKDTVMSPDGSRVYFALQDVPAGIALTNEDYWILQMDLSASKAAMDEAVANFADYAKQVGTKVRGETARASGNPVTFLPDAGSLLQPVTVLEPQQEGSGDPAPANIRPITGYDKLGLVTAGKNYVSPPVNVVPGNATYTYDAVSGTFVLTKGSGSGHGQIYYKLDVDASKLVGKAMTISCESYSITSSGHDPRLYLYAQDIMTLICRVQFDSEGKSKTFTVPDGTTALYLVVRIDGLMDAPAGTVLTVNGLQLELGSVASGFQSYQSETHTVQIGQTVYGGRMDWLTGKLTDGIPLVELDGDEVVSTDGGGIFTTSAFGAAAAAYGEMWCSHYVVARDYDTFVNTDMSVCVWASGQVRIHDSRFSTVSEINTEIAAQKAAGTPVQIVYKLANPIEIQLTPHVISAADPEQMNTLYGDGTIEVEYVKPLHVSIEDQIAAALAE